MKPIQTAETTSARPLARSGATRAPCHADPAMPWLVKALDPVRASAALAWSLPPFQGQPLHVRSTRILQCKAGRRAVVAYETIRPVRSSSGERQSVRTLVGKTRARGLDVRTYRTQHELVKRGFGPGSDDGISVPLPLGLVPEWSMWVQELAPGERLDRMIPSLGASQGRALMARVALAVSKLHRAGAPTRRTHTIRDELRILADWLRRARDARPDLSGRISRLFRGCVRLARAFPERPPVGVHRDLHPGQIMVDDERLSLLDLDLYALGDPGLDYGNLTAHLTELAIRLHGDPAALDSLEETLRQEAHHLDATLPERHLRGWHLLSLARHVGLSTVIPGRDHTTDAVLDECERLCGSSGGSVSRRGAWRAGDEREPPASRRLRRTAGALALALGSILPFSSAEAQLRHDVTAGIDLSSIYDSNVNRDPIDAEGMAGISTTGILRYRVRGSHDLRTEYEIGLHQYDRDTPWNRVSHKFRADARRPMGELATLGLVAEYQVRGSGGEDRSLGNQFSLEPSVRRELRPSTEIQVELVSRVRSNPAGERERNHFAGVELTHELTRSAEIGVELRYERNFSENGRRDFRGPRVDLEWTQQLSEADEVRFSFGYRDRSYLERLVDTDDGEALRHDTRSVPGVRWRRDIGGWMRLSLEYEYEARSSNDPDKNLGGHLLILGAQVLR